MKPGAWPGRMRSRARTIALTHPERKIEDEDDDDDEDDFSPWSVVRGP
jgi:hypothetical protein